MSLARGGCERLPWRSSSRSPRARPGPGVRRGGGRAWPRRRRPARPRVCRSGPWLRAERLLRPAGPMCRKLPRTLIPGPRCAMTGPGRRSTGMPPISSPLTSPAPPDRTWRAATAPPGRLINRPGGDCERRRTRHSGLHNRPDRDRERQARTAVRYGRSPLETPQLRHADWGVLLLIENVRGSLAWPFGAAARAGPGGSEP